MPTVYHRRKWEESSGESRVELLTFRQMGTRAWIERQGHTVDETTALDVPANHVDEDGRYLYGDL